MPNQPAPGGLDPVEALLRADGHAVLTGSPGSGKTWALASLASRLASSGAAPPLVVLPERRRAEAFSRLAAASVAPEAPPVPSPASPPATAATPVAPPAISLHALALRLVRPVRSTLPLVGDLLVLREGDRAALLRDGVDQAAIQALGGPVAALAAVDAARRDGGPLEGRPEPLRAVLAAYEAALPRLGRTDAPGMAAFAVAAVRSGRVEGVAASGVLLFDGWEDLDPLGRDLVLALRQSGHRLVVASATLEGLPSDLARFPLSRDRRSPRIVAAALSRVLPDHPLPERHDPGSLVVRTYASASQEAAAVAAAVARVRAPSPGQARRSPSVATPGATLVVALLPDVAARVCAALLAAGEAPHVEGWRDPFEDELARLVTLFLSVAFSQPATSASGPRAAAMAGAATAARAERPPPDAAALRDRCLAAVAALSPPPPPGEVGVATLFDCLCIAPGDRFASRLASLSACWRGKEAKEGVALHSPSSCAGLEADHAFVCGADVAPGARASAPAVALTRARELLALTASLARPGPRDPAPWLRAVLGARRRGDVAGSLDPDPTGTLLPLPTPSERSAAASPLDFEGPGVRRLRLLA